MPQPTATAMTKKTNSAAINTENVPLPSSAAQPTANASRAVTVAITTATVPTGQTKSAAKDSLARMALSSATAAIVYLNTSAATENATAIWTRPTKPTAHLVIQVI